MVVGGAMVALIGRRAARTQFEEMRAAPAPAASVQTKKDLLQQLQKLGSLMQQDLLTDEF